MIAPVVAAEKVTVKTARISEVAIYPERSAPAAVVSLNESVISARIAARVDELSVRVGDIVEKGGDLAKLDCSDYELAYRESVARLEALQTRRDYAKRRWSARVSLSPNNPLLKKYLMNVNQTTRYWDLNSKAYRPRSR